MLCTGLVSLRRFSVRHSACRIFRTERRQKTAVVVVANDELLVLGVATNSSRGTVIRRSAIRYHGCDLVAFPSTLSSKFILTSVILPSVSRHSPRTSRPAAACRSGRRPSTMGSAWLSTSTRVTPHKHEASSAAPPFASHHPLIDDHVTIRSTPFHSMHRSPPGLLVADDNADECGQAARVPFYRAVGSLHVIYHVSSCVTERICLVGRRRRLLHGPQCLVPTPL